MVKTSASQFKAKMGRYMAAIRAGQEVLITDRNQPLAKLIPIATAAKDNARLKVYKPRDPSAPALGDIRFRKIRYSGRSTTEILLEDRDRR